MSDTNTLTTIPTDLEVDAEIDAEIERWRTRMLLVVEDLAKRCPDLTPEQLAIVRDEIEKCFEP